MLNMPLREDACMHKHIAQGVTLPLITISRPQAGDIRTVFRRALSITWGTAPAMFITSGPGGTRVRAKAADTAVEYLVPSIGCIVA